MRVQVASNVQDVVGGLTDLERRQVPFALSQALNKTALEFQKQERKGIDEHFSLRRKSWAQRNVKIGRGDFATKKRLVATVRMEAPGDPSRSDVLAKFEAGGTKQPKDGGRLAIPDKARRGKGVIPEKMRPKAFAFELVSKKAGVEVYKGDNRTFMIKRADGTGGIYQRTGKVTKGGKTAGRRRMREGRDLNVRTLYRFTQSATIDSRLHFEATANGMNARISHNFEEALAKAIQSGRTYTNELGKTFVTREARRTAHRDLR